MLTSLHLGLTADKDEGDHPNNSFSPCSAHDRRCLQKHFAKIRDRSTSGGKMKVVGVPREEARPVVRTSDLQMCMCIGNNTTATTPDLDYIHSANILWMPTVCKMSLVCVIRTQRVLIPFLEISFPFISSVHWYS